MIQAAIPPRNNVVVIGHGMVGHRFCQKLASLDEQHRHRIVTFCEEPRAAYDRVGLTSFFTDRSAEKLMLANLDWYRDQGIELHIGDRAQRIDRVRRVVHSEKGRAIPYDTVVLATGSYPFVPSIPGVKKMGVFVYRTIEDLEAIIAYAPRTKSAAVMGGGLLGLEAAKAVFDLGLETHVVESAPRLMPRQLDEAGASLLAQKIRSLGVRVHLGKTTQEITGEHSAQGLRFADGETLDVGMLVISAGIRPRDELARACGLAVGERGGVVVNDFLQTSDPDIYAIGEVALHKEMVYGLVAPGYKMAEVVAARLAGQDQTFAAGDLSAKLKLMGVDVASFGDYFADDSRAAALTHNDPFAGVYKKLLFSQDGKRLLGGIMVGDAADYSLLSVLAQTDGDLKSSPSSFMGGSASGVASAGDLPDEAMVCTCNTVTKGAICEAIRSQNLESVGAVKNFTKAGTGCGGCLPLVSDLFARQMKLAGKVVVNHLCEHFPYSRRELWQIMKVNKIRTFQEVIHSHGKGLGCEVCKPAVASILAGLWNEEILDPEHQTLQDTNDRFLANMQRGGLYSVIPRVPGGEITPEKLIVLGRVAKRFSLYSKITGAQRIDLFGAKLQDLPDIWEELVNAGFESGHAYGKAVRTVKSCVGTTWCRFGVQDSVGFAIRVEERYRGIRAPHKIKMAVSGCVRECAEAQNKDFGMVATEHGYNLYVCGNGGAKPRHADLLAADIDEATCLKYVDRTMMYYIQTADRMTRTSIWLEKMEGGIEYLKGVVIQDKLGICQEMDRQMQFLVETYKCEWAEVVKNPQRRRWFRQFVNTQETESPIDLITQRSQQRPADWPKVVVPLTINGQRAALEKAVRHWVRVGRVGDFPKEGGSCVKYGSSQIAVFNFTSRNEWYATQNMCPHKNAFVLARGIIGTAGEIPKVACPMHKNTFSLQTGKCVSGPDYELMTFPVKVQGEEVHLFLPPEQDLDALLATDKHRITATCATASCKT